MTSVHEPVLHALSVESHAARPGESVSVIFRTRNLGTSASPPATVAFVLGDGFEPLGEPEIAVESVAPGEDVVAVMRARVRAPLDDRTELTVQALLRVPDAVLATNICTLRVRSRPVLDGAASGTFVEPVDADRVRVRVVVTNEGDGAARDVRVDVPPPAGCSCVDGGGGAVLELERLEVGASVAAEFEAWIVEPVAVLQAGDGVVRFGGGRRCVLPVREVVVMDPLILAPCVEVQPSRRSVDVVVDVRNDGWVDARDVRVRVALPAPARVVDGTIVVDGVPVASRGARRGGGDAAFARVERSGGAYVVIAPVAARSTVRIGLTATFPAGCTGGTIVAGAGAHEVAAPFVPELVRDLRMRVVEVPRAVAAGNDVIVQVEAVNAGDVPEALFFCITGNGVAVAPEAVARTIAPGAVAVVELVALSHARLPEAPLALSVVACDAERERARADVAVVVREPVLPYDDEPSAGDANDVPAVVHAALHGPDDVSSGAPFAVRLDVDVEDPVDVLVVRVHDVAGATYVPGSTSLDGRSLLDRGGASPLAGAGLSLRGVPAGTRVTAAWNLLADPAVCNEALIVEAVLDVNGEQRPCPPVVMHVRGRDAFAPQPAGLPYHVDACIIETAACIVESVMTEVTPRDIFTCPVSDDVAAPSDAAPASKASEQSQVVFASDDAFTFALPLSDECVDEAARLLNGAAGGGLVSHVLALRPFFPERESSGDPAIAAELSDVRTALRELFDRLFVKLRIPGFDVVSDDLDDVTLRRAMMGLFEALQTARPGADHGDGATVRITRARACELLAALSDAPYGAPAALRALVALLPVRCDADPLLSGALARYACALDDVFARYEGLPLEIFDDALARASDRALDDARAALALALRSRSALAELSC
jgi:hypothetical protein